MKGEISIDDKLYDTLYTRLTDSEYRDLCIEYLETVHSYNRLYSKYCELKDSNSFRITAPLRIIHNSINKAKEQASRTNLFMKLAWFSRKDFCIPSYAFGMSKRDFLNQQKKAKQNGEMVKFSILVPLYNTPKVFLKEMIASCLGQSYENWELCLTDGSDDDHGYVKEICELAIKNDSRIKYKKLDKNLGISANTNECLKMATGDWISLFDHDDLLHPAALYEIYDKILNESADFIYSDEAIFLGDNLHSIKEIHYKPEFSLSLLETNNYICHFTSFKKELLGDYYFDSECDGAQDYDVILRLTEKAKVICHVNKILYYWRASPQSTAYNSNSKDYTTIAGKKALQKHFSRIGESVIVVSTGIPNNYQIIRK